MLSARYHIATIIAIFLSLGLGIVIGGTFGQKWAVQAENSIVHILTNRYEAMLAENQAMKKQIGSLELFLSTVSPSTQTKIVWWYRTSQHNNDDLLAKVLKASGVQWVEKDVGDEPLLQMKLGEPQPDIILVSDPIVKQSVEQQFQALEADRLAQFQIAQEHQEHHTAAQALPQLIDVSDKIESLTKPDRIVEFIIYMKQLVEEESYAAANSVDIRDHPGME